MNSKIFVGVAVAAAVLVAPAAFASGSASAPVREAAVEGTRIRSATTVTCRDGAGETSSVSAHAEVTVTAKPAAARFDVPGTSAAASARPNLQVAREAAAVAR